MKLATSLCFSALVFGQILYAGGNIGGGSPPALQEIEAQLMSTESGHGGIRLLINRQLQSHMTLSKSLLIDSDIKVEDADFEVLRSRNQALEAIGSLLENRSFTVADGDSLDSLLLIDRRTAARASIKL